MAWGFGTPDSVNYLNSPVLFELSSLIRLITAVPLKLVTQWKWRDPTFISYIVIWCPMVIHSVSARAQWHARSCCLNDEHVSAVDTIALSSPEPQEFVPLLSPNRTCPRFHAAPLSATDTCSPVDFCGLYEPRAFCDSLDLLKHLSDSRIHSKPTVFWFIW